MSQDMTVRRDFAATIRDVNFQKQIQATLPSTVSIDRFTATTITAINHNPKLLEADRQSLYNGIVKAAQDGLLPDGVDGVLNIYNTNVGTRDKPDWKQKVQWQKMVGGIIKQFAKAGIPVYAASVYAQEAFRTWNDDSGQHVTHEPIAFGERGERIGAFACASLRNGRTLVATMNLQDLEKARKASKSPDKGPWVEWPERMEQKSVLHRLSKRVSAVDDRAAEALRQIGEEFADAEPTSQAPADLPEPPKVPAAPIPKRPKALQAVVDAAQPTSVVLEGQAGFAPIEAYEQPNEDQVF